MNKFRNRLFAGVGTLSITAMAVLTACGDDQQAAQQQPQLIADGQLSSDVSGGTQCMTAMTPEQKNQLVEYTNANQDAIQVAGNNPDGTQDICILETQPDGSVAQKYYNQSNFGDYLLYSMMFGRSNALIGYGVISGDLSFGDAMALQLLTGVNSGGGLYHPYSYTDRGWGYQPRVDNRRVTNVYINGGAPVPFKDAKPPVTYKTPKLPTSVPQPEANAAAGSVTQVPGKSASADLKTAKPTTPKLPDPKKKVPAPRVARPTPVSTPSTTKSAPASSGSSSSKSAPTTTTTVVQKSTTAPKPTSVTRPTVKTSKKASSSTKKK